MRIPTGTGTPASLSHHKDNSAAFLHENTRSSHAAELNRIEQQSLRVPQRPRSKLGSGPPVRRNSVLPNQTRTLPLISLAAPKLTTSPRQNQPESRPLHQPGSRTSSRFASWQEGPVEPPLAAPPQRAP